MTSLHRSADQVRPDARQSRGDDAPRPARPARPAPSGTVPRIQRYAGNALAAGLLAGRLYRCGPVPCDCPEAQRTADPGVPVSDPHDPAEREAEQVADEVMRGNPAVHPGETVVGARGPYRSGAPGLAAPGLAAPPATSWDSLAHEVRGEGRPLDAGTRGRLEPRFGTGFGDVRVHAGPAANAMAGSIHARAFTAGADIFFAAGEYRPGVLGGDRLLAHELTHVVQQRVVPAVVGGPVHRQYTGMSSSDADAAAEREYGDKPAPKATKCGRPSYCPAGFCDPYRSQPLAEYYRSKNSVWIMAGIAAAVDSRVVPLWREYLWGGSPPKNLTSEFGKDFTASPTTRKTTTFLYGELRSKLTSSPPKVATSTTVSVGIDTLIPTAIAALRDPASPNQMNFSVPRDIPGNLAGGIGADQSACPAGAQPSPFNDDRRAQGVVELTRGTGADVTVKPRITYTVKDTIDLCPGDCGTRLEQIATVPLSQFEATGISGDVPFTVEFPAPSLSTFTVAADAPPSPPPPAPPAPAPPVAPKPGPAP